MAEQDGPASTLAAAVSEPPRAAGRALKRADERMDEWVRGLSDRQALAYGAVMFGACVGSAGYIASVLVPVLIPTAAAQEGGTAEELMCGTGAGEAISIIFGLFALILSLMAAARFASGMNKRGSARSDKKREGEEQLTGALYSLGGVFVLIGFPLLLERLGLSTISCVTFAPF